MKKFIVLLFIIFFFSCKLDLIEPAGIVVNIEADTIRFAAMGDYGDASDGERLVSELIDSYQPDFILALGDNNYPDGKEKTLVENIGQFYCDYIYNFDAPTDQICKGKAYTEKMNRFFPTSGNHDYDNPNKNVPYLNYFTLPGNEIYYEFVWGPVHFYSIDTNIGLFDQQIWFNEKLSLSEQEFNVVFLHHSPYSEGMHGNFEDMQWNFEGVDLVLSGHDHIYQRITKVNEDLPVYIISGLGGHPIRSCNEYPLNPTQFNSYCYNGDFGSLFIEANDTLMLVKFVSLGNDVIDSFSIQKAAGKSDLHLN